MINKSNKKIAIIGLGYVGLPLAVEFGRLFETIGFDINNSRVLELLDGDDSTLEVAPQDLQKASKLRYSSNNKDIQSCNIFIVTVPTPIDENKKPILMPLIRASEMIGKLLKKDDIVIYESTVYPGATEELCVPILEQNSGLIFNKDFYCGYSPERINPGDKEHRITSIKKVTSGSTPYIASQIDELYQEIIVAGTHKVSSIKIAEAAKVIENTQRDLNIALINEFAIIFNLLDIDTEAVLEAAGTKWNFLSFKPGLVGGHCIGVDPYYLTHKAIEAGYSPEIILAGRKLNDNMGSYVADQLVLLMTKKHIKIIGSNILIMGLSFKENCPDIRNTRIISLIESLKNFDCNIDVYDPWVDKDKANFEYNLKLVSYPESGKYDAIVLAVAHDKFKKMTEKQIRVFGKDNNALYDIKYMLNANESDKRL